jgi:DNA-binding response OmpR family regulator
MCKVLVVDDDKDLLGVLKIMLTFNGLLVNEASGEEEFYLRLGLEKPSVILLDVNLGTSDGRDICKMLKSKQDTKDIPVILFSANHNMGSMISESKADDFIEKPFEMEFLVNKLKSYCNLN